MEEDGEPPTPLAPDKPSTNEDKQLSKNISMSAEIEQIGNIFHKALLESQEQERKRVEQRMSQQEEFIQQLRSQVEYLTEILKNRNITVREKISRHNNHQTELEDPATTATMEQPSEASSTDPLESSLMRIVGEDGINDHITHARRKTRYRPILTNNDHSLEEIFKRQPFARFFNILFEKNEKRKMCPFKIEQTLSDLMGAKPQSIRASGQDGLTVEVSSLQQAERIEKITELNGIKCSTKKHSFFNGSKGLIYLQNVTISDFHSFQQGLWDRYDVTEAIPATWIKPRKVTTQAIILNFDKETLPSHINIIGEYTPTKVYEFNEKPMHCRKCNKYGHSEKRCESSTWTCRKCAQDHPTADCTSDFLRCANCDQEHQSGHKDCPSRKREEKIINILLIFRFDTRGY